MRKEFKAETPELILIITDNKKETHLEKAFQKGLDQIEKPHVALSLYVTPKNLKKLLTAIKLMDVKGLFIAGKYKIHGKMFADTVKSRGPIDTVVLKGNRYYGFNTHPSGYKNTKRGKVAPDTLTEQIAASIKLWTRNSIDTKRLKNQIRRIYVK